MITQILLIFRSRLKKIEFVVCIFITLLVIFLTCQANFSRKVAVEDMMKRGDELHLTTINFYEREQEKRGLNEVEKAFLEEALTYHKSAIFFKERNYENYVKQRIKFWNLRLESRKKYNSLLPIYNENGYNPKKKELLEYKNVKQYLTLLNFLNENRNYSLNEIIRVTSRNLLLEWTDFVGEPIYFFPILFTIVLFLINGIFLDDFNHKSLLYAKPLREINYIVSRIMSYFLVLITLFILFIIICIFAHNLVFGAGDFSTPILVFRGKEEVFLTYFQFAGSIVLFVSIILLFLICLETLINYLFENKMISFIVGIIVIWLEPILGFLKISVSFADILPFYYISFGPVIHGAKDDFYANSNFTIQKGIIALMLSSLVFLIISSILSRWKDYRRWREII